MVVFPELLQFKCPAGLSAAVTQAARQRHMTSAEYARRALLDRLETDGLKLERAMRPALQQAG